MKARVVPLKFAEINAREREEFDTQLARLREMYGDCAEFLTPANVGDKLPDDADIVVFPQLVGEAFGRKAALARIDLPVMVITSEFGTVEMWDWEIVTFLRDLGLNVFSPYTVELAKCIFRAVACKRDMENVRFLMFQDDPGEGMQANIFKRFYWWEKECTDSIEKAFGLRIIYRSYKELCDNSAEISDYDAREACRDWNIPREGVSEENYLKAVKVYIAVKEVIDELGDVDGVGANCLNESFHSETTPCLAWNMLYERDGVLWVCEGDTLSLVSKYILHSILRKPMMMTNVYPFLMGMAALKHEKIDSFPDIENAENHALCAHCAYFGLAPQSFCAEWTLRPAVLEIVNKNAVAVDCRLPEGPTTLAKLHPGMRKLQLIECEIAGYVQYPGSDCRNGALLRYVNNNGHDIMEALSSHHALLISGGHIPALTQAARVFGFEVHRL